MAMNEYFIPQGSDLPILKQFCQPEKKKSH